MVGTQSPVLAENDLNSYPTKDSDNTGENGKDQAGTYSAAFSASTAPHLAPLSEASDEASLRLVTLAWPHLSPEARRGILAIVRSDDEKVHTNITSQNGG
jgi:hypothetical protein